MLNKRRIATWILALALLLVSFVSVRGQYNKDYFYWVGRNNMINNNYRAAIDVLNSLLRFDDDAYEAYFLRGIAKYNLNDLLGADADFTLAIDKNPVYTGAYVNRAITRSRLGNYDDALRDFEEAIELRPDMPNPYYSRGVTRLLNQQPQEAIKDFDEFVKYEDKVSDAFVNRGICYLQMSDTTQAMSNFNTAVRTNRQSANAYNRRGSLHLQLNNLVKAESDFDCAIAADSSYLLSFFNRSIIYNDTQRPLLALSDLDQVIKLDSTSSLSFFNRAIVRSQVGDYNRALEDYNRVVDYSPSNVLAYFYRANLLSQLGEVERAESDYTKSIELYPDFANAYLYRSNVRYLLGKSSAAKKDRVTAERKIEQHKSKLKDSTYSIYADTTYRFDKLLSFGSDFSGSRFENISLQGGKSNSLVLIPLFRFTFAERDTTAMADLTEYQSEVLDDFLAKVDNKKLTLGDGRNTIEAEELIALNGEYVKRLREQPDSWQKLFEGAVSQGLIKQYTNSVNTYTAAIELNPTNPFLYLNRSTTQAEMIDFISSIDNSYQRISIDSDPANRLQNTTSRNYNYDEAISDLNKVLKLYPDFPYAYYNRANLHALSGKLPEAYDDYTKAIDHYAAFAEAYYNRGVIQIYMKDTRKGCIDISKAGELGITEAYEVLKEYTSEHN